VKERRQNSTNVDVTNQHVMEPQTDSVLPKKMEYTESNSQYVGYKTNYSKFIVE
jgi:hypothetical protein